MDALATLFVLLAVLVALDLSSLRWGADSRRGSDPRRDWR